MRMVSNNNMIILFMVICGLGKFVQTQHFNDREISIPCFEKATKLVKTLYSDMKNLEKQHQRIDRSLRIMGKREIFKKFGQLFLLSDKKEQKTGSFQECSEELGEHYNISYSWIASFEETIGGGDVNNLLCHDQEGLEETHQLRSLGKSFLSFYLYIYDNYLLSYFPQELSWKN